MGVPLTGEVRGPETTEDADHEGDHRTGVIGEPRLLDHRDEVGHKEPDHEVPHHEVAHPRLTHLPAR